MFRPKTPIPNGCSFTLFSCKVNLPSQPPIYPHKLSNSRSAVNLSGSYQTSRISLKSVKSPQSKTQKYSRILSNNEFSVHNIWEGKNSLEQVSAGLQSENSNGLKETSESKNSLKGELLKNEGSTSQLKIYEQKKQLNLNLQQQNEFNSSFHQTQVKQNETKQQFFRTTRNTNQFSNQSTQIEKRFTLQQTKQNLFTKSPHSNQTSQVYQSHTIFSHQVNPLIKRELGGAKHSEVIVVSPNNLTPLMPSRFSNNRMHTNGCGQIKISMQMEPSVAPPTSSIITNSQNYEMLKSPKKFNTLKDINCKHVASSGGDKTSSNHISLLASQQTINNGSASRGDYRNDNFTKVIKLMTMKSIPLREYF